MNTLKRILGVVWILLGIVSVYYLFVNQAMGMWKDGGEKLVPAIIYTFVLCPIIAVGLFVFGYFSIKGEYND
jgi:uncharacterized membrane protein HdeD (DUF308 family)